MPNVSDHDLLMRIDERITNIREDIVDLQWAMRQNRDAIVRLRLESAKWGALGGFLVSVIVGIVVYSLTRGWIT